MNNRIIRGLSLFYKLKIAKGRILKMSFRSSFSVDRPLIPKSKCSQSAGAFSGKTTLVSRQLKRSRLPSWGKAAECKGRTITYHKWP